MRKLAFALLVLIVALCGCSTSDSAKTSAQVVSASPETPVNLEGEWKSVTDTGGTTLMFATIENDSIVVKIVSDDVSSLYWKGTFFAPQKDGNTLRVESAADKAALDASLMGSGADAKTFTYKNKQLSFDFTALGTTRTIKMER